ncbi:enoyl-CoA hydratase [Fulvimonas soli]|uniref:Enoyl-CoA hydratase n=1 Tax=Fulvimonas soli TaxID=155197 RepID=A0A316IHJ6_9GAMM|nr:enoyl-CoA hydratase [Fulvimonas soli]PWK91914.1 enoyl-CoA hydratase [Fulvimonas soli]TNY26041.1 enoyl-CoA hydratase [Fulvimonas soli]
MSYNEISYEVIGAVARVCHNRPQAANAESEALLDELDDALERAKKDDAVRVLIIGGKGKHFSSGHDLVDGIRTRGHFTSEQIYLWEQEHYLGNALRIWDFPKPTIAQVQGACIAGGFMVANMCDLMVASDDAYFSDPVVHSLGAAAVETLVHPWVLGMRKAKEFLYTGQRLSAAEAKEWGMVNHVVPREELEAFTLRLANRIAETPPVALHVLKRSLNRTADIQGFRNAILAHFDTHVFSHSTAEHRGIVARGMEQSMAAAKKSAGST